MKEVEELLDAAEDSLAAAREKLRAREAPAEDEPTENLRIPVTRKVWDQLTRTALDRRVTVRYLCLEALSQAGYDIDMSKVPEDGRRTKKGRVE